MSFLVTIKNKLVDFLEENSTSQNFTEEDEHMIDQRIAGPVQWARYCLNKMQDGSENTQKWAYALGIMTAHYIISEEDADVFMKSLN